MKKILIVEGNLREENQSFTDGGIKTHTESLKDSIAYFTDKIETDVVNPSSDKNISEKFQQTKNQNIYNLMLKSIITMLDHQCFLKLVIEFLSHEIKAI